MNISDPQEQKTPECYNCRSFTRTGSYIHEEYINHGWCSLIPYDQVRVRYTDSCEDWGINYMEDYE